jgi:hypothetical protein
MALLLSATLAFDCLEYQSGICVRCAPNLVLLSGNCTIGIAGCLSYFNVSACAQCNTTLFSLEGTQCVLIGGRGRLLLTNLTLYQLAAFGDYQEIPLDQLAEDDGF